jgi:hypothetical protein
MAEEVDRPPDDAPRADRVVSLARTLLATGGLLEATGAGEQISHEQLEEALTSRIEMNAASGQLPPSLTAKVAAANALANAERALKKTAGGASPSNLTDIEVASLEAIIEVTGRPSMRYRDGHVQMPPTALGENDRWRVLIAIARLEIDEASASVGRISVTSNAGLVEHKGTGWCAAGGLIVTNRHVARKLVRNPDERPSSWTIDVSKQPFIEFATTDQATDSQRFAVSEVAYCAEEEELDVALLGLSPGASSLPPPLTLDWKPETLGRETAGAAGESPRFTGRQVYVVGHPYRRLDSELTAAVFGAADGGKRWSPGIVIGLNPTKPLLEHDCSTLGGNSGSCVLSADWNAVVGIHVGGVNVNEATGRGSANLALTFARMGTHRAANILRTGKL